MAREQPTQQLLKQLQALERMHGRLVVVTARIRVQGEIITDLVKLAQTATAEKAPAPAAGAKTSRVRKPAPPRRAPRKGRQVQR